MNRWIDAGRHEVRLEPATRPPLNGATPAALLPPDLPDWAVAVSARLMTPDRALVDPVDEAFVRFYFAASQQVTNALRDLGRQAWPMVCDRFPFTACERSIEAEVLPLAEVAVGERVAVMTSWAWCWPVVRIAAR